MVVVINKFDNVIPVDFGEFQFEFEANDASIKRLSEVEQYLVDEGQKLNDTDNDKVLESIKNITKKSWEEFFGEGAFEKVYKFSGESSLATFFYLIKTARGVIEEFQEKNSTDALSKYLDMELPE